MNRILFIALLGIAFLAGCKEASNGHDHGGASGAANAKRAWHCPMHPQVIRDKPADCPICGMDLVEFVSDGESTKKTENDLDTVYRGAGREVSVSPSVLQKIGVRTDMADNGVVGRTLVADAEGVLDKVSEQSVTVRTMGYLESVKPLREGDKVGVGQILAMFYGPELVTAQGDWLASRGAGDSVAASVARERLVSLGLAPKVLEEIGREARVRRTVPILAPATGWIRSRAAIQGQSVMAGQELFRIVEGSGAILEARIPQGAIQVAVGDPVEISGPGIGKAASKVVSVVPELDRSSRSVVVRLGAVKGERIQLGGQYRATFTGSRETGLVIPADAVLHSGRRDVVFLALGDGKFRPVEVELGATAGGKVVVRAGLEAGDEVVVSAQFLLDGESRLQSALDQMTSGAQP